MILTPVLIFSLYHREWFFAESLPLWHTALHIELADKIYFLKHLSFFSNTNLLGQSLLENPGNNLINPFTIIHFIFNDVTSYKISVILQYVLFFIGIWSLIDKKKDISQGILISSIIVFSPLIISLPERSSLGIVCWLPWVFYFYKNSRFLLASLFASLMAFSGDPVLAFFTLLSGIFFFNRNESKLNISLSVLLFFALIFPVYSQFFYQFPLSSRSSGIPVNSVLAFSIPLRDLLDIFITHIGKPSKWFSSYSLGLPLFLLVISPLVIKRSKRSIILVSLIFLIILLSLGSTFYPSTLIFKTVFPFTSWRYPAKFIIYCLVPIIILLEQVDLKKNWLIILLGISFVHLFTYPSIPTIPSNKILGSNFLPNIDRIAHRVKVCDKGIYGKFKSQNFNTRVFQIPNIKTTNNVGSDIVKIMPCQSVLHPSIRQWLGVTHLVTPFSEKEDQVIKASGFNLIQKSSTALYQSDSRKFSPLLATLSSRFKKGTSLKHIGHRLEENRYPQDFYGITSMRDNIFLLDSGISLFDGGIQYKNVSIEGNPDCPTTSQNIKYIHSGKMQIDLTQKCSGLVAIPWRFMPGWRAVVGEEQRQIVRINNWTMGVFVKAEDKVILLDYKPLNSLRNLAISLLLILGIFLIYLKSGRNSKPL